MLVCTGDTRAIYNLGSGIASASLIHSHLGGEFVVKFEERHFRNCRVANTFLYTWRPTNTTTLSETNYLRALIHGPHYICQFDIEQLASHRHLQLIKRILQRVVAKRR